MSIDEDNRERAIEIGAFPYYWAAKTEGKVDPETLSIALDAFEEGGEDSADDFLEDYTFDVPETYDRSDEWEPDAWVVTEGSLEGEGPYGVHNRKMSWGNKEPNEYYGPHTPLLRIPATSGSVETDAVSRSNATVIDSWEEEDETDFLSQFIVRTHGAGSAEYFLRQDLGPLPTQLAEAIGSLENYSILDEEAHTQLEQEDEEGAWEWAHDSWRDALIVEHEELTALINLLNPDQLYGLYREAADEENIYVEHSQEGVYFGDWERLAQAIDEDQIIEIA